MAVESPRPSLAYTRAQSDEAQRSWGANCGPHSLAAALAISLSEVQVHLGDFRGWMSPSMIERALISLGRRYERRQGLRTATLCRGISRVQWHGPWLDPGVPAAAAYAHTHWVAQLEGWVLCTVVDASAWVFVGDWGSELRRQGRSWHVTDHYELR